MASNRYVSADSSAETNSLLPFDLDNTEFSINSRPAAAPINPQAPTSEKMRQFFAKYSDITDNITTIANNTFKVLSQPQNLFFGHGHPALVVAASTDQLVRTDIFCNIWGVCAVVGGVTMLLDTDNYRSQRTSHKVKAYSAILAGIGLMFTDNHGLWDLGGALAGPTGLVIPAFGVACTAGLVISVINLMQADYENTLTGWIDEREKELAFLNDRIKEEQQRNNKSYVLYLQDKKNKLIQAVQARCRVRYHENRAAIKNDTLNSSSSEALSNENERIKLLQVSPFKVDLTDEPTLEEMQLHDEIIYQTNKTLAGAKRDFVQNMVGVIGVTLFVIALFNPVTAPAAHFISLVVACYFLAKLIYRACNNDKAPVRGRPAVDKIYSDEGQEPDSPSDQPGAAKATDTGSTSGVGQPNMAPLEIEDNENARLLSPGGRR